MSLKASTVSPIFLVLCGCAVALRLFAALTGDNYDMQSWWIASEAFSHGESIYAATHRYNYGPIWFAILGGLRYVSALTGPDTITRLHLFITGFLSLVDLALASYVLRRTSSVYAAAILLLNPISVLVTGYHVQFDNFAILLGLLSWQVFSSGRDHRSLLLASALLGASLTTKHIFSIFLAWLPFLYSVRTPSQRLAYGAIACALFATSFIPWLGDPTSRAGILANVLRYVSTESHSLIAFVTAPFAVPQRTIFVLALAACGPLFMRCRRAHTIAPLVYLILLTALSSGMARNYLAIPIVTLTLFSRCVSTWAYLVVGTLALVTTTPPLGVTEVAVSLTTWTFVTYELLQLILIFLACEVLKKATYGERGSCSAANTRASS
jgi:hypothetical protein